MNRLGKGTLVKELQAPGTFNNGKPNNYALGLELSSYRGLPIVEHSGALYGYRTSILPISGAAVYGVVPVQSFECEHRRALRKIAEVYLADSLKSEADAPDVDGASALPDPSRFAGKYLDPGNHFVYTFSSSAGELIAWGAKLRRMGPNQFHDLGTGVITFSEGDGNMAADLAMDGENFFSGKRVEPMHLDAAASAAYSGKYHSAEIDATYRLLVKNGDLLLQFKWDPALKLDPVAPDTFESGELGALVFHLDADGRVMGFSLYEVSARGVAFERTE